MHRSCCRVVETSIALMAGWVLSPAARFCDVLGLAKLLSIPKRLTLHVAGRKGRRACKKPTAQQQRVSLDHFATRVLTSAVLVELSNATVATGEPTHKTALFENATRPFARFWGRFSWFRFVLILRRKQPAAKRGSSLRVKFSTLDAPRLHGSPFV